MVTPLARPIKVIVDTSVWIDFFNGKLLGKEKETLILLLEAEEAVITDIIKHELLIGANSASEYSELNDSLSALEEYSIDSDLRVEFNRFGFELRKRGFLGKYTDSSIAFLARTNQFPVYSFDKYFSKLAQKGMISILPVISFTPRG